VDKRYGVAPLPGTRSYFDPTGQLKQADRRGNYVPYLGAGSRVGVVFDRSPHRDAAWDLLADLAGATGSTALLTDPAVGAGPFRTEHLDEGRDELWLGYRFDPERTGQLARAVRQYVSQTTVNPALPLRSPDQGELMAALEAEVRKAAAGQVLPDQAMRQAQAAWEKHDAGRKPDELATWRRNAAGIP
jgi:ABC-type glycerol-3-phosphate transport system substrate-binding protein